MSFSRYLLTVFTGLTGLFLSLPAAHSQELPLWEIGIGTGVLNLPLYRGVDQIRTYAIPFPLIIYRGEHLSIDEGGAHTQLFNSENINIELSLAGGIPVPSDDGSPRTGMPDLDPTAELGPSVDARFWHSDDQRRSLWLRLPLRAAISVSLDKLDHQGWTFSPFLEYTVESPIADKWKIGLAWGPLYADRKYHNYFYQVSSAFVLPLGERDEYHARSGYSGNRVTLTLQKKNGDLWLGAFIRYDNLDRAVFLDSPLVNSREYLAVGLGFTYIFSKSKTLVDRTDD